MKEVVKSMVEWQQGRCLDPGVWNHLRTRLNPRLLPAQVLIQPRPPLKRKLDDVEVEDSVRIFTRNLLFKFEKGTATYLLYFLSPGDALYRRNDVR